MGLGEVSFIGRKKPLDSPPWPKSAVVRKRVPVSTWSVAATAVNADRDCMPGWAACQAHNEPAQWLVNSMTRDAGHGLSGD